jgi:hypothetical protein
MKKHLWSTIALAIMAILALGSTNSNNSNSNVGSTSNISKPSPALQPDMGDSSNRVEELIDRSFSERMVIYEKHLQEWNELASKQMRYHLIPD